MPRTVSRVILALLAITSVQLGLWATFAPRSFYEDFPGGGRSWVAADGPYNEHLVRDFGDLNLAIALVALVALVTLARPAVLAAAGAWLIYGVPHLVYHLRHLDVYDTSDQVANVTALALVVVVPALLLWAALSHRQAPARAG